MEERNKVIFQLNQNNQIYTISTSLTKDKINLECKDSRSQIYENTFSLPELLRISQYFQPTHSIEQIQAYLNGIIEKQKIGINQADEALSLNLYLINNDQISIPLLKKLDNSIYTNYPFARYNSMSQQSPSNYPIAVNNISNVNNVITRSTPQSQFYSKNSANIQRSPSQNIIQTKPISPIGAYPYPRVDNSAISSFSLDENKLSTLENENKMIKEGQEKLKNDIKRFMQEMNKLKQENQVLKTNQESLKNQNSLLKNESDNYKKQILIYQNENNALKKQYETYNKDLEAVENQNDQIRKMYEDLENEYNQYKEQTEEINKENELLRNQIIELNNNFTMINKELENIRNENDTFKTSLEQQKQNLNEDMVNKLIEENNMLKKRLEENEYLKKQIEELQYQIQSQEQKEKEETQEREENQEKEEDHENQGEEEEEDKGEIIHSMKELELITDKINRENKKIIINLLYKASVDGDKASVFHDKCDQAKSTIVLVETLNGKRFGGFTSCSWAGNCEDKNDPSAFIFSLDKMKTYENIPGDEAIGCYPKFGPIFLGCQIKIFDNAFTKGGTTFEKELNFNTKEDYELTGGDRVFQIKDIEVYEVIIE